MFAAIDPWILSFSAVTVAITIFMGFWSARRSKTASDFFVAGRSVSVGWNASAISGEYLSAASFMGVAGMVMSSGYDALWYPVCYACGYLFLLLFIAGPLRRFGAYTIPDFAEGRYDSPIFRKIAVIFVMFIGFFYTMPQMKGAGTTLAYIFPGLPYWVGVALVGAVITLNVALGGMKGITLVQAFQYWAKMFAISVPIFVLMSVYGHYGKQLEVNGQDSATGMLKDNIEWVTVFQGSNTVQKVKGKVEDLWGQRVSGTRGTERESGFGAETNTVFNLLLAYGESRWCSVLRAKELPNLVIKVKTNMVAEADFPKAIEGFLNDAGVILIREGDTVKAVAKTTLSSLRKPLPEKAPADPKWISPFGPLTTKAAAKANASVRWNLSPEIRATLRDAVGRPPLTQTAAILSRAEDMIDGSAFRTQPSGPSQFADWTNMPPNTSRSVSGGFPVLSTLREIGLLTERQVVVATNLPRGQIEIGGSFQSLDELLESWEAQLLTNGVRLDWSGDVIKAVSTADWDRYVKNPSSVPLVPNRTFGVQTNAETRFLADLYGKALDKVVLMTTNLPAPNIAAEPQPPVSLLAHEAAPVIEKILSERGVTFIPANKKEVWAVPTSDLAKYRLKPVEEKPYALLYTYSLIIALVCGTAGLPHILVRFYTNPDGVAAKRTTMWVMILIGIFYVFPPVFGVIGRNLMPELYTGLAGIKGTDQVVLKLPMLLNERVPMLGSILSGITCAGAFAAFMSTFSGLLVSMTGALAHDVYGRILRPKSTPDQRMRMFKFGAVLIGGVAILLGMQVEQLEINFMVGQAFAIAAASYFPLLFMSVWWRGMTIKGAATGMLTGGLLALGGITLTSVSDIILKTSVTKGTPNPLQGLENFWIAHPGIRILCEQPAIWAVPLAIILMVVVSKLTRKEIPSDVRMKMLVLHAPEKLGLKQEYIQEHQGMSH